MVYWFAYCSLRAQWGIEALGAPAAELIRLVLRREGRGRRSRCLCMVGGEQGSRGGRGGPSSCGIMRGEGGGVPSICGFTVSLVRGL